MQPFEVKQYQGYGKSDVATTVQSNEPRATQTPITIQRSQLDTLGRAKSVTVGSLEWKQTMDQAGNVTSAAAPGRPSTTMDHDARGLVTSETLADGSVQSHQYHGSGAATAFADPTSEQTQTDAPLRPARTLSPNTLSAAARGRQFHRDEPSGLPDQLRAMYPETVFAFTPEGGKGQDVRVVGGKHPSEYPASTWPGGIDYGDFKPDTEGGRKTFNSDQRWKWTQPTVMLPYNPNAGEIRR